MHVVWPEHDISDVKDSWTVVTGCTDGIGRAYINELARARGVRKFYLIGRNPVKLEVVKKELEMDLQAEVKTCVFDFEHDDFNTLPSELKSLEVGILSKFSTTTYSREEAAGRMRKNTL
ncbi:hypothetical protein AB6A40_002968 [Gnathostoma spinigerum]|uniref:Uncharacterized protein n=1 Tax=Gnathostoma spinigerum TaxID=75299 RepID=A0ABD6E851_9BILA